MQPLVSILLPVFNAEAYVAASIESLLAQTFTDFELLIIDDGSTDQSAAIIQTFTDPRIRFFQQPTNQGLIATLNSALDYARGQYIARQDADDISLPQRLAKQVAWMEQNPSVAVCGSWIVIFGDDPTTPERVYAPPTDPEAIRAHLLFHSPVAHSTILARARLFTQNNYRYEAAFPHAEDYRLFAQIAQNERIANLPEALVRLRQHQGKVSVRFRDIQQQSSWAIQEAQLAQLGLHPTEAQKALHTELYSGHLVQSLQTLGEAAAWLKILYAATAPSAAMATLLRHIWSKLVAGTTPLGCSVAHLERGLPFLKPLPWWHLALWKRRLKMWLKLP